MPDNNKTRLRQYKYKGKDIDALRRKRAKSSLALRKQKRDDQLKRKRNIQGVLEKDPTDEMQAACVSTITWILSKFSHHKKPWLTSADVKQLFPGLVQYLHHDNKIVVRKVCGTLASLTEESKERIKVVVKAGAIPRLIQLLHSEDVHIVTHILKILHNIITWTNEQTWIVVNAGVLDVFSSLLRRDPKIQKSAIKLLSAITACKSIDIQTIIDADLVPLLVEALKQDDRRIQEDAMLAILSFTSRGTAAQVAQLHHCNVLEPLLHLLTTEDIDLMLMSMNALYNILQTAQTVNEHQILCCEMELQGLVDVIETLQSHPNEAVYVSAMTILMQFFQHEILIPMFGHDSAHVYPDDSAFQF